MKRLSRILAVAAALLMIAASLSSVFADMDGREDYDYTIKIYSGKEGKFVDPSVGEVSGDGKTITITVKAGDEITIDQQTTGLTVNEDSEYYPRGFRIAGHDAGLNSNEVSNPNFAVYEDRSYEVAYGLKGGMVKYTVLYLDGDTHLRDADVYYGMVGDKPVVSYKYVDGYQPNAYNLKKTLQADETENVFPFTYKKVAAAASDADEEEDDNAAAASGSRNANSNANRTGAANADDQALDGADAGSAGVTDSSPAEIVDLDDGDTPLADAPDAADIGDSDTPKSGVSPVAIGAGAAAIAALAAAGVVLARRRRAEYEDDEE